MGSNNPGAVTARVLIWKNNEHCTTRYVNPSELKYAVEKAATEYQACLVIVEGLSDDYRNILQRDIGIDPDFIDAHVKRRTYYPIGKKKDHFWHLGYPEAASLVEDDQGAPSAVPFCATSHDGCGVIFCRVSAWTSSTDALAKKSTTVVLLDKPTCKFQPGHWESSATDIAEQSHRFSFQRYLEGVLADLPAAKSAEETLKSIDAVLGRQWMDLFDTMNFNMAQEFIASLMWQIHQNLEMNFQSASGRHDHEHPRSMIWERLLERSARTGQVFSQLRPPSQVIGVPYVIEPPTANQAAMSSAEKRPSAPPPVILNEAYLDEKQPISTDEEDNFQTDNLNPLNPNSNSNTGHLSPADENQRSLERLSYLGGVLLPFSIVSGILSMNDDYSPTGPLFFIYWAVTIPLTIIALVVIYADSIRKSEVWVEVASVAGAAGHASSLFAGSTPEIITVPEPLPPTTEYGEGRTLYGDLETGLQAPLPPVVPSPGPGGEVTETITYSETISADPRMTHSDTALEVIEQPIDNGDGNEQQGSPATPAVIDNRMSHDPMMAHNPPHRYHHGYSNEPAARKWKKQQLGWFGACKTLLGVHPWGKATNSGNESQVEGVVETGEIYYGPKPTGRRVYSAGTGTQVRGRGRGRGRGGRISQQRRVKTTTM